jgi:hypothetical protein
LQAEDFFPPSPARSTPGGVRNRVEATFEIVYGHAWRAHRSAAADGRSIVRFERAPQRRVS